MYKRQVEEWSTTDIEYKGTHYHYTPYGPKTPGQHWYDVYFDNVPEAFGHKHYSVGNLLNKSLVPDIIPKFNKKVYKRAYAFSDTIDSCYDYIQIRYFDYGTPDEKLINDLDIIYNLLKKSDRKYHIGSNNEHAINTLSSLDNVYTYKFNNLDLFTNDHMYYHYNSHINNDMLLDRLYDNLAEMVTIANADTIYGYTSFTWISNILFYGMANSKELKFTNFNHLKL